MSEPVDTIAERLMSIRSRMAAACARAGRDEHAVRLVAVSKTHPVASLRAALDAGQGIFGENRVQEALPKIEALGPAAEFHFLGHLQRNKVNVVVGAFALIHSVDSVRLIEALEKRAAQLECVQPILLELNLAGEASKTGAPLDTLPAMLQALAAAPHLEVRGLMTVPPYDDDVEAARPVFRQLRTLCEACIAQGTLHVAGGHPELSMGMSHDFEVAIEEGATLVRIGTAIFGERPA